MSGRILPEGCASLESHKLECQWPAGLYGKRRVYPNCRDAAGYRPVLGSQDTPAAGGAARIFPLLAGRPAAGLRRGAYHEPAGAAFRPPGAGHPPVRRGGTAPYLGIPRLFPVKRLLPQFTGWAAPPRIPERVGRGLF